MTRERFIAMSFAERARWVHFNGEFILSIRYYEHKVNLYLIDKLYVEVFYHHLRDCVDKIDLLDDKSSRVVFYTDQISLPNGLV